MVEYSGLIPLQPVDWGKVAQDASKPITDVIEERKQQRKALEQDKADSLTAIQKYEQTKAPNGAEFIMNASQEGRSYIMAQYELLTSGQITPEEYKRRTQNTRESFKMLDTYMKTYEKDITEAQARVDSGDAGAMEQFLTNYRGQLMDLGGKYSTFGENGLMYMTDKNGRVYDLQSVNMGINKRPVKVNLADDVDKMVKGLGIGAKMVDGVYTISNTLVGDWKETKNGIKKSLMDSPTKIASIMADNMAPNKYSFTTEESEAGGDKILIKADQNGIMTAQPTPEQREEVEKYLDNWIESRIKIEGKDTSKASVEELKARIALKNIQLEYDKMDREDRKELEPIKNRLEAISTVLEGRPSLIVGRPMSYQGSIGSAEGETPEMGYPGYVVNKVQREGADEFAVTIKNAKGTEKVLKYTERGLIADLNGVFNEMKGEEAIGISKLNQYMRPAPKPAPKKQAPKAKTTTTVQGGKIRQ